MVRVKLNEAGLWFHLFCINVQSQHCIMGNKGRAATHAFLMTPVL